MTRSCGMCVAMDSEASRYIVSCLGMPHLGPASSQMKCGSLVGLAEASRAKFAQQWHVAGSVSEPCSCALPREYSGGYSLCHLVLSPVLSVYSWCSSRSIYTVPSPPHTHRHTNSRHNAKWWPFCEPNNETLWILQTVTLEWPLDDLWHTNSVDSVLVWWPGRCIYVYKHMVMCLCVLWSALYLTVPLTLYFLLLAYLSTHTCAKSLHDLLCPQWIMTHLPTIPTFLCTFVLLVQAFMFLFVEAALYELWHGVESTGIPQGASPSHHTHTSPVTAYTSNICSAYLIPNLAVTFNAISL